MVAKVSSQRPSKVRGAKQVQPHQHESVQRSSTNSRYEFIRLFSVRKRYYNLSETCNKLKVYGSTHKLYEVDIYLENCELWLVFTKHAMLTYVNTPTLFKQIIDELLSMGNTIHVVIPEREATVMLFKQDTIMGYNSFVNMLVSSSLLTNRQVEDSSFILKLNDLKDGKLLTVDDNLHQVLKNKEANSFIEFARVYNNMMVTNKYGMLSLMLMIKPFGDETVSR